MWLCLRVFYFLLGGKRNEYSKYLNVATVHTARMSSNGMREIFSGRVILKNDDILWPLCLQVTSAFANS